MNISSILTRRLTVVIAGIVIVGTGLELLPITVVRIGAVLALLVQIAQERRNGDSQFLTSPLFLLGAATLLLFSFVLSVLDPPSHAIHLKVTYDPHDFHLENIDPNIGGDAERILIIFGLCCVAVHSLIAGIPLPASSPKEGGPVRAANYVWAPRIMPHFDDGRLNPA